jgi:hypothetical protein
MSLGEKIDKSLGEVSKEGRGGEVVGSSLDKEEVHR